MAEQRWEPPDLAGHTFTWKVGNSVLTQFVRGHGYTDILRELVQNEYDAGGRTMKVLFGESQVSIQGSGRPIDSAGWRRLSVMLGTGTIAGSGEEVKRKANGIGSKNFGLRSLFRVGDQIWVRSAGRMTVMDPARGALARPLPDAASVGEPGVVIHVPYRAENHDELPAFTIDEEQQALDHFRGEVAATLLKLAQPGRDQSLNDLVVESTRLQRKLRWRQTARVLRLRHNLRVIDRAVRLEAVDGGARIESGSIREAEYRTVVSPPDGASFLDTPAYFRERGGRVVIGLSFRLAGRRADINHIGGIYYPLLAPAGFTGCAVSLNAPFEMDTDRSQPLGSDRSRWNDWLLDAAADFTAEMLPAQWFERFGADAYSALLPTESAAPVSLALRVLERVKVRRVWPSAGPPRRGKSPLHEAKQLATPARPILARFLQSSQVLIPALAEQPKAAEYARRSGSKVFTVNSLIRLRCKGQGDKPAIATRVLDGEANYYYTSYPEELLNADLQRRYGEALDQLPIARDTHIRDLKESRSTLAANGELMPGGALWAVPAELSDGAPIPVSQQLHSALLSSRVLAVQVARPFSAADWVRAVAAAAASGHSSEEEVAALESFILTGPNLPAHVWAKVRSAPVIRDTEGRWVKPAETLAPTGQVPSTLTPVFHVAATVYAKEKRVLQALRLHSHISSADLVEAAERIADEARLAPAFEQLLKRHPRLIHRGVVGRLRNVRFLQTTAGDLAAPEELHVPNSVNRAVLGDSVAYVGGRETALYVRLGCRDKPSSAAIIAQLERLRQLESDISDVEWDTIYGRLVEALDRERSARSNYRETPIVCLGGRWYRPADVLVGAYQATFLHLVPVVRGARGELLRLLGAASKPQPTHWRAFFAGLAARHGPDGRLSRDERAAVLRANASLDEVPHEVEDLPILLDRTGRLHKITAAKAGRLLIDDDPRVASGANSAGIPLDFVDDSDSDSLRFYEAAGVRRLTSVYKRGGDVVNEERRPAEWVPGLLKALQAPVLGPAIERFMDYERMQRSPKGTLGRRLGQIREITVAASVTSIYRIGGRQVHVGVPWALTDSGIAIAGANKKSEGLTRLAEAVASLATNDLSQQRRLLDAIYRLLECRSVAEVVAYLESHGIKWHPPRKLEAEAEVDGEPDASEELRRRFGDLFDPREPQSKGDVGDSPSDDDGTPTSGSPPRDADEPMPLPHIENVSLEVLATGSWSPPDRKPGPGGGGGGGGSVRDAEEEESDRELGRRGEELIYNLECARLALAGVSPDKVVWVSKDRETSDHDIRSLHDDGKPLFIEVKTTAGTHGKFVWPRAEFDRALNERDHCILWRVYEGRSKTPKARPFADPVGLLLGDHMRIDLDTLSAEVEPL